MDGEIGVESGECVVGCGCGCGFDSDGERDRIEEFIEGVRWEERGGWLPEVEFDEDASTKSSMALDADAERRRRRIDAVVGMKKAGKGKPKKKARVSGLSYY
jgi:hypothetical protein